METIGGKYEVDGVSVIHPAWGQMLDASWRYGMPEHYEGDLKIDYELLHGLYPSEPAPYRFVWILRRCGTHICDNSGWLSQVLAVFTDESNLYFWFDGRTLCRVSKEQAVAELASAESEGE